MSTQRGTAPLRAYGTDASVPEAGQRALIAYKRMNWFANPPRTPKRYRNPRGFRKKEVKLQAGWSPWARRRASRSDRNGLGLQAIARGSEA